MKRTYLKHKKYLNPKSSKQKIIDKILVLIKAERIAEKGNKCEICGKPQEILPFPLSIFHILPRFGYPNLKVNRQNILLACWNKERDYYITSPYCHNIWERHKFLKDGNINPKWQKIEEEIKRLRGEDYYIKLKAIDRMAPKLNMSQLNLIHYALKKNEDETNTA